MSSAIRDPRSAIRDGSPLRAFVALVGLTFRRHWRVRSLGWVSFALLALMVAVVGIVTHVTRSWPLENQTRLVADPTKPNGVVSMTYREYGEERLTFYQLLPDGQFGWKALGFAPYRALMRDEAYLGDFAFLNFSRWVVFGLYLGFLLPLFMLAFGSGALGGEREDRTLIWLATRPMPREAIYLAKFLGILPWCVAVAVGGFGMLCLAGGELGWRAFAVYWPDVAGGAVGFAALFHLVGALFRRPAVLGLAYIFFFEILVTNLPGSLKRLSVNYYVRSLLYNDARLAAPRVSPETLDVYEPVSSLTAWVVLLSLAVGLTLVGSVLFARQEPKDDE